MLLELEPSLFGDLDKMKIDLSSIHKVFTEQLCILLIFQEYNLTLFMKQDRRERKWPLQLKAQYGEGTTKKQQLRYAKDKANQTKESIRRLIEITANSEEEPWQTALSKTMLGSFDKKGILSLDAVKKLHSMAKKWRHFCEDNKIAEKIGTLNRVVRIIKLSSEATLLALQSHSAFFRNLCLGTSSLFRCVFVESLRRIVETYKWLHSLRSYPNIVMEFRELLLSLRKLSIANLVLQKLQELFRGEVNIIDDEYEIEREVFIELEKDSQALCQVCKNYEIFAWQVLDESVEEEENKPIEEEENKSVEEEEVRLLVFRDDELKQELSYICSENQDGGFRVCYTYDPNDSFPLVKDTIIKFILYLAKVQLPANDFENFKSWHHNLYLDTQSSSSFKKINKAWVNMEALVGGQKKGKGFTWSKEELEAVVDGYNEHGNDWQLIVQRNSGVFKNMTERVAGKKEGVNKLICKKVSDLLRKQKTKDVEEEFRRVRGRFD
jgi:hypothetical protein